MKKVLAMMFALTLVLTGCGGAGLDNADGKKSGVTLNVYNWGDYIDPDVLDMFTDETGIKVNYENFNNNEELLAKIEAGSTNYDVLFPSDYMVGIMRKKGLLQKLDFENIKNVQYIDDRFKALSYDPDNEYNVPYMWQTV